jgi:hypothetical protein
MAKASWMAMELNRSMMPGELIPAVTFEVR